MTATEGNEARIEAQIAVRIHAFEPRSRANGPGARFVVWFQGCIPT